MYASIKDQKNKENMHDCTTENLVAQIQIEVQYI